LDFVCAGSAACGMGSGKSDYFQSDLSGVLFADNRLLGILFYNLHRELDSEKIQR